jgi:hypothetical protein
MSHYNIAVTVGPNIFRPKEIKPADLINAGTFYDVMIRFMTDYDEIFAGDSVSMIYESPEITPPATTKVSVKLSGSSQDMMAQCMKVMDLEEEEEKGPRR